ncbi:hypothetical protein OCT63_19415 [Vibrio sp. RW]|uniref:hypothetical protein n=1 Tax=Vibrio sp. RW TaxID=2998833 RepID=UPI0022CD901E|nr:hypothetical protein [Vibrio sp. RW]MDA0146398.1 hypothetical protein [Vibrio sp. RW]
MWTRNEIKYLSSNAGRLTTKQMSKILDKSEDNIRQRASQMGISLAVRSIAKEKIDMAREMIKKNVPASVIVKKTGLSHTYIHNIKFGKIKHLKPKFDQQKFDNNLKIFNAAVG